MIDSLKEINLIKNFDELLERIKTIRVSERMSYQKITNLFITTSIDYNSKSESEYEKFRIKQDQEYIFSMNEMYKKYLEDNK